MQRAKHDCIYGHLEYEFDEQFVLCAIRNKRNALKGLCSFYSQELSRQEDCQNYDRVTQCVK